VTRRSGCNALRPLRNTRGPERTAPAAADGVEGAALNDRKRSQDIGIIGPSRFQPED
jgi:hypothetical protein